MDSKQNKTQNSEQEIKNDPESSLLFQRNRKRTSFAGKLWTGPRALKRELCIGKRTRQRPENLRPDEDAEPRGLKSYNLNRTDALVI